MSLLHTKPIRKNRDGSFRVTIGEAERNLVYTLARALASTLEEEGPESWTGEAPIGRPALGPNAGRTRPGIARLFPPAYLDNDSQEEQYESLVGDQLGQHHVDSLRALARMLKARVIAENEVDTWLIALNDLRLVLGEQLGVTDDDDPANPEPSDRPGEAGGPGKAAGAGAGGAGAGGAGGPAGAGGAASAAYDAYRYLTWLQAASIETACE